MYQKIYTEKAPKAVGPYSQAIAVDGFIFASGQVGLDPETGKLVGDDVKTQTKQMLNNIDAVLKEAKVSHEQVVKTTCFLTDMKDFADFNEVYGEYFTNKPARSCVAVKELPLGALVEVEVIIKVD